MAGSRKRVKEDEEMEENASSDDSGSDIAEQEIEATFEGRNIEGEDFEGIKQLLDQLFPVTHQDLTQGLTDMLINQSGLGSVLKQSLGESDDDSEDDDMSGDAVVYGVTSALNLTGHSAAVGVQQLYKLIKEASKKYASQAVQIQIEDIVSKSKVGMLVNERFINIPSRISGPLFGALEGELTRAQKRDAGYKFDYYLILCKVVRSKSNKDQIIYLNGEEEIFVKHADLTFEYSISGKVENGLGGAWDSDDEEYLPSRAVVLFKSDKLNSILSEIKTAVQA